MSTSNAIPDLLQTQVTITNAGAVNWEFLEAQQVQLTKTSWSLYTGAKTARSLVVLQPIDFELFFLGSNKENLVLLVEVSLSSFMKFLLLCQSNVL